MARRIAFLADLSLRAIAIEAQVNSDRATPSTDSSEGPMAGSVLHEGDIVSPVEVEWDADQAHLLNCLDRMAACSTTAGG